MGKYLVAVLSLLLTVNLSAFDKVYEDTLDDFEDLIVKENGVKINNFSFAEKKAYLASGLVNIEVSFSVQNKNDASKHFTVMIVGKNGTNILWAISAEPMMTTVMANQTETVKGSAYVSPGILKKTKSIWLRIVGDI